MKADTRCRVCGHHEHNVLHVAREMMYGLRDTFPYIECAACGCVQIQQVPADLSRYYPSDYWSFEKDRMAGIGLRLGLSRTLRRRRTRYWLTPGRDVIGWLLAGRSEIPRHLSWARRAGVRSPDVAVLDIGCGLGDRLLSLREDGFSNLAGADPFIAEDVAYEGGVHVRRCDLCDVQGTYDYITLHHSFEHMPDPMMAMRQLRRLLRDDGTALIRIPVASSDAWRRYGVNWVQLDAPRHLFLHTVRSIEHLAAAAGMQVADVQHDSDMFQFWGSEQYLKDIPLYDERSFERNPDRSIFSAEQLGAFKAEAARLNRLGRGDQACFYLRMAPDAQ